MVSNRFRPTIITEIAHAVGLLCLLFALAAGFYALWEFGLYLNL